MIIEGIIAALVAGAIQLAQAAGQSIQQWIGLIVLLDNNLYKIVYAK